MLSFTRIAMTLGILAGLAAAQEAPEKDGPKADGPQENRVVSVGKKDDEQIKVLKPTEIPAELARLKTKADIKAEVSLVTEGGRPIVFKGVIRNGKLIERLVDRRFVPQKDIEHSRSGVRLWWAEGSDGYIFFRYASIKTLSITGKLTDAERREIMARLKAKREGKDPEEKQAAPIAEVAPKLDKMSERELESFLLRQYPYDKGWNQQKYRTLKREQLIENKQLNQLEATFVKYFHVLAQARFKALQQSKKKIEIEPGSAIEPPPGAGRQDPEEDDRG